MSIKNIAFLDTETTGLSKKDQAIEVTLYHNDGRVLFDRLIKPRVAINYHAQKVHGITESEVARCSYWEDVADEFEKALSLVDTTYIFNESFDNRIMQQTYEMSGLEFPEYKTKCAMKEIALELNRKGLHSGASISLDKAAEILGEDITDIDRHRALGDCIATQRVYSKLFDAIDESTNTEPTDTTNKSDPNISNIGKSDAITLAKAKIDKHLENSITFSDWSNYLRKDGILVVPLIPSNRDMKIPGISFVIGEHHLSGSLIGKSYTISSLFKKGLSYNPASEYDFAVELYINAAKNKQFKFVSDNRHNMSSPIEDRSLLKSSFEVNEVAKIGSLKIRAKYRRDADLSSNYTQLALDEKNPKSIQLKELSIENVLIELEFDNRLDKTPKSVKIKNSNNESIFDGTKCVSTAVKSLPDNIRSALTSYFKDNVDSSIISVMQGLVCASSGRELSSIRRFSYSQKKELCTIIPKLR